MGVSTERWDTSPGSLAADHGREEDGLLYKWEIKEERTRQNKYLKI